MENAPDESRFEELDRREVQLLGRNVITLYVDNTTYEPYVLVQNFQENEEDDSYYVVPVPKDWNPNIVFMNPWDFR